MVSMHQAMIFARQREEAKYRQGLGTQQGAVCVDPRRQSTEIGTDKRVRYGQKKEATGGWSGGPRAGWQSIKAQLSKAVDDPEEDPKRFARRRVRGDRPPLGVPAPFGTPTPFFGALPL